jgi:two-component system, NarL family, response regulator LiaR
MLPAPAARTPGRAGEQAGGGKRRMARVLVHDRQRLLVEALASLLGRVGFSVDGVYTDLEELLQAARTMTPDVVVLNATAGSEEGVAAVAALRRLPVPTRIVALVDRVESSALDLTASGAVDALLAKTDSAASIVAALRQLLGGHPIQRGASTPVPADAASPAQPRPAGDISDRQRDVLRLVASGRSNAEIAAELFISVNTVKFHLRCVYRELGISNRVQVAQRYAELLEPTRR